MAEFSYLVVRLGSLGDVIHAIPAAAAIREQSPAARLDWMVDPRYAEVLQLVEGIDRIIPFDPRWLWDRSTRPLFFRTLRDLRAARYDAAIDLQGLVKSAVIARLIGARAVVGFVASEARERLASTLYTASVDTRSAAHVIHKNLMLLRAIGIDQGDVGFPLKVGAAVGTSGAADVAQGEYALINPGAAWPNKRWPPERFAALATALRADLGLRSLVLWGPGERETAEAVVAAAGGAAVLSPPTSIVDIFNLARAARVMVSGDTGPLHIAAAVGTPLVALFGPTRAERNGPWARADVTISRVDQCSCVYERRCRRPNRCIDTIRVDEVAAAVRCRMATR